jgi:hypothetical protein
MRLFSYIVKVDAGFAPNPFGGVCTLTNCKPVIRRVAKKGDWIVGLTSTSANLRDLGKRVGVVYAMKITDKLTMAEYDDWCNKQLKIKIPKRPGKSYEEFVGDCIYSFKKTDGIKQRKSCHKKENMTTDLGGKFSLMSDRFYYFGENAPLLPESLIRIKKSGRGHQSDLNDPYKEEFVKWIAENFEQNKIYGEPINKITSWKEESTVYHCSKVNKTESEEDEKEALE